MNELDQAGLARLRDGWISGGAAFELAPAEWKEVAAASSPDEQERRLLAIAAQALDVALRPAAPKILKRRPPLPVLALPMLPERLRPSLRAALKYAADARRKAQVVKLVASRGFVTHPMDWMPSASDQTAPDIYAPWIDWQASAEAEQLWHKKLTLQSWAEFFPAARRVALTGMRRSEPAVARQLIEAKGPAESAEVRLSLVELIRIGLGPDDAPFLKSLATDRSTKVRELAGRLLAMLGQHGESGADVPVAELAGFIEEGKAGFIRRRTTFGPAKTKSHAQEQRRAELFELCNLVDLVARFGVTESDFITGWQFGTDNNVDILLSRMVAASGSDTAVAHMADRLVDEGGKPVLRVLQLTPRLDSRRKRVLVRLILKQANYLGMLNQAESLDAGWLDWDDLTNGQVLPALRSIIGENDDAMRRAVDDFLETMGFLATATAATRLIDDLVAAGLPPASPSLGLLRLNAALAGNPPQDNI
ncbi:MULTISPECIES: DUF5691 domain-containing protein [unclassified Mesorhizobium]|uniref:DUF5691 domain-containing protein n=1 Tax=unclassified Mesorhizobium TaxID=325217 RepID=UPI000FCA9D87|nr:MULTISPECIES: DUF5691 domain-containing protein [unclassified Mesorhizobium]RVD56792.1 hypothetical protein EN783_20875 [Mesorhizobium sp. M2D.F.Ca.ET.140.01.1.1]TGP72477.1 hypothetical protein EN867_25420 [Mesorhizobium sp. M2D.F.Ca.ET.224.01.1.1]TGP89805.1 hypothetical protein EN865_25425 [bacterium M00.F.Ca.ET.222.01.1.1]